jgi:hypothetical protein
MDMQALDHPLHTTMGKNGGPLAMNLNGDLGIPITDEYIGQYGIEAYAEFNKETYIKVHGKEINVPVFLYPSHYPAQFITTNGITPPCLVCELIIGIIFPDHHSFHFFLHALAEGQLPEIQQFGQPDLLVIGYHQAIIEPELINRRANFFISIVRTVEPLLHGIPSGHPGYLLEMRNCRHPERLIQ